MTNVASNGSHDGGRTRRSRRPHLKLPGQAVSRTPAAMRRRRQLDFGRAVIPALAAGAAVTKGAGDAGDGLLMALATYLAALPLLRITYPLDLMRVSRLTIALLAPLVAASVIALAAALGSGVLPSFRDDFVVPVVVAFLTALVYDQFSDLVMARRPLRAAVIGAPSFAAGLERELGEDKIRHISLLGWLDLTPGNAGAPLAERIAEEVERRGIDLLIFGPDASGGSATGGSRLYAEAAEACLELPVRLIEGNQFYEDVFGHVPMGTIDSAWYLFLVHPRFTQTPTMVRRGFTLALSVPLAILVAPLLALAAVAIKLDSRGPVFYRQTRVGGGGEPFEIIKLRTMSADAEAESGARFSQAGDVRVTRVGRILRRTHLDELPQLINILRGEMTLVGPRPERPEIVAGIESAFPHYSRRHLVKPGVTGWAQVRCGYAGSTLGTAWKLCHDLYYLKRRTLLTDFLIMIETLAIAAKDSHRPLRVPESQFVFGEELGIDISADVAGGVPELDQVGAKDLESVTA